MQLFGLTLWNPLSNMCKEGDAMKSGDGVDISMLKTDDEPGEKFTEVDPELVLHVHPHFMHTNITEPPAPRSGRKRDEVAAEMCSPKTVLLMTPGAVANLSDFAAGAAGAAALLVPGNPVKDSRNPLFTEGAAAWDAYYDNGYPNVIFDDRDQLYKTWYGSSQDIVDAHSTEGYRGLLNYRESRDGISWPMPSLGIIAYNGSTANNIVSGYAGGVGVTLDESSSVCRFKAVGSTGGLKTGTPAAQDCGGNGAIWCSADGKHWENPLCTNITYGARWDTHNNLLKPWVGADWVLMSRADTNPHHFVRTESRGVVFNWTDDVSQASFSEQTIALAATAAHQLYTMTVFSAAEAAGRPRYRANSSSNLFLGLAMIFNADGDPGNPGPAADRHSTVDCELAMSTDTINWQRVFPGRPFIKRGKVGTYDDDLLYCGARPFEINGSHRLYYAANRHFHDNEEETPPWGKHPGGSINLARLELDRWAGYTAGLIRTSTFILSGSEIHINVEMRRAKGSLAVTLHLAGSHNSSVLTAEPITTGGTDVPLFWGSSSSTSSSSSNHESSIRLPPNLLGKSVFLSFAAEAGSVLYSYSIVCVSVGNNQQALKLDDEARTRLVWAARRDSLTAVPVIQTPGHYEYEPTALRQPNGVLDVWTCSGAVPPHNFDAIAHTRLAAGADGAALRRQRPLPVLVPTHNSSHIDGWGACAPSVVAAPAKAEDEGGAQEELRMFYECAAFLTDRATGDVFTGFCQVCLARSRQSGVWEKWGGDERGWVAAGEPAEPVVTVSDWMLRTQCRFVAEGNGFLVDKANCTFYG